MKCSNFFLHNWLATLYLNFKMLSFKQAIKLPIEIYGKIRFINTTGNIIINTSNIYRGMIKIGSQGADMFANLPTIIDIKGELVFSGDKIRTGRGSFIRVEENGKIELEHNVAIGAMSKLFCESSIIIKENTITSWDCQIMDTDTHSIIDIETNEVYKRSISIVIGKNNWLGNNVTINKGTQTPNDIIIASNSLCNKNYIDIIPPYSIIGGIPAKLIAKDKRRLGDKL